MKSSDLGQNVVEAAYARRTQANNDAVLVERRKVAPFGFTLVCFERGIPWAV
jgi:hypothetical protein